MKIHNITVVEEKGTDFMFVPYGKYFVCIGKKDEVLAEGQADLGRRVIECIRTAEYHTITGKHRRVVH